MRMLHARVTKIPLLTILLAMSAGAPARAGTLALQSLVFSPTQTLCNAYDINDDGQVAAAYIDGDKLHAAIWKNGAITHIKIGRDADARQINAQGVTVGAYTATAAPRWSAYVYEPATRMTRTIAATGRKGAFPTGINSSNVVVGYVLSGTFVAKGFEDNNTVLSRVDVKGASSTVPLAINDAGIIAGEYLDGAGVSHGFTRSGNTTTTIDPPGSTSTTIVYIAPDGAVVGIYVDASVHYHGFLERAGVYTTLDYPGSIDTYLVDITSTGEAVGEWRDTNGRYHGLIWVDETYYSLDFPGATLTQIVKVNAAGSVVGDYVDAAGATHGFVGICPAGQGPCTSGTLSPAKFVIGAHRGR